MSLWIRKEVQEVPWGLDMPDTLGREIEFFSRYLSEEDADRFVGKCFRVGQTDEGVHILRMKNRIFWYSNLADKVSASTPARLALPLIFLFALVEGVEKLSQRKADDDSTGYRIGRTHRYYFEDFIQAASVDDREKLTRSFIEPSGKSPEQILSILWKVRSDAAHGRGYWIFDGAATENENGFVYHGQGKVYSEDLKSLETIIIKHKIDYEMLRDIFVRTAIGKTQLALCTFE